MASAVRRFLRIALLVPVMVGGLALALATPAAAQASDGYVPGCSIDGGFPELAVPADGEQGVPLDGVVSVAIAGVRYEAEEAEALIGRFSLLRGGGVDVALTGSVTVVAASTDPRDGPTTFVRLTPVAALEGNAEYHVLYTPDGGTPADLGTFVTGLETDDTAPEAPPAPTVEHVALCDGFAESCCECGASLALAVEVPDTGELLTYELREGTLLLALDAPRTLLGVADCDDWIEVSRGEASANPWHLGAGPHTLTIVARDRAGNESAPTSFEIDAHCDPDHAAACPVPTEEVPDAGGGGQPGQGDGGDGCSCRAGAGATAGSLGSALLLAAAVLVSLRRTGRPRRRR
jgi:hypothetical protein